MYDQYVMATRRVQVLLDEEERRSFQSSAKREGQSLSAWLRDAGRERLDRRRARARFESVEELNAFFDRCRRRERGTEPDWDEHRRVIAHSVASGRAET
jgi:hypothetical protein